LLTRFCQHYSRADKRDVITFLVRTSVTVIGMFAHRFKTLPVVNDRKLQHPWYLFVVSVAKLIFAMLHVRLTITYCRSTRNNNRYC